jgi:hypothetical protein
MRLQVLALLRESGQLTADLEWTTTESAVVVAEPIRRISFYYQDGKAVI